MHRARNAKLIYLSHSYVRETLTTLIKLFSCSFALRVIDSKDDLQGACQKLDQFHVAF